LACTEGEIRVKRSANSKKNAAFVENEGMIRKEGNRVPAELRYMAGWELIGVDLRVASCV